jgi:hypothetical protein
MTYTLTLYLKHYIPLITQEVDYSLHHLPLTRTMFHIDLLCLIQSKALAYLVDPELQAQVETAKRLLLQDAHRTIACVATRNLLATLKEVGGVDVE